MIKLGESERMVSCTVPESALLDDVLPPIKPSTAPCEAERDLYRAILESALHDLSVYRFRRDGMSRALVDEVQRWMSGQYEVTVEYDDCCAICGLDPGQIRKAVSR
jgi:hypothetical protein